MHLHNKYHYHFILYSIKLSNSDNHIYFKFCLKY